MRPWITPRKLFFLFPSLVLTLVALRKNKRQRQTPLGAESKSIYQPALPGRTISFPADHHSHPEFKIEWWYYTGHLETDSCKKYGYQATFFRCGLRDQQKAPLFPEIYMAHFALSDLNQKTFIFRERMNPGYRNKAGAATDRYVVWIEDWKIEGNEKTHVIQVRDRGTELRLTLQSLKPAVLHGENGFSRKGDGEGRASYYYSLTRMATQGTIATHGKSERARGLSWMDHEFGSNQLGDDQVGWDWFSIQLSDQTELMLYIIRHKDGSPDPHSNGTLVQADTENKHLLLSDFQIDILDWWKSPKSAAKYPSKWKVSVPAEEIELQVIPVFYNQELITNRSSRVTYWEGAVEIAGSAHNKPIAGVGYVEMTGYAGKLYL
jgi:predicted secreted hydrolase